MGLLEARNPRSIVSKLDIPKRDGISSSQSPKAGEDRCLSSETIRQREGLRSYSALSLYSAL